MSVDPVAVRTRRAVLGAGLASVAALVGGAVGRVPGARAANGSIVTVGSSLTGTSATEITNTALGENGIVGQANVFGLYGISHGGHGVHGQTTTGTGVAGVSASGSGVLGATRASDDAGVIGRSGGNGVGVWGISTPDLAVSVPTPPGKTGIFGYAVQDSASVAVYGRSDSGTGVYGTSPNGQGVYGDTNGGTGVTGVSSAGVGVRAKSAHGVGLHATSDTSVAIRADSGPSVAIAAFADSGDALHASSSSGRGILSDSSTNIGVYGYSRGAKPGTVGLNNGLSSGVMGASGTNGLPAAPAETGVYGIATNDATSIGVYGRSSSGTGVYGTSPNGNGVYGDSGTGSGIYGLSNATDAPATVGRSQGGSTGVLGFSGPGGLPPAPAGTGVYGHSVKDASSRGVWGHSASGHGVHGDAVGGIGVFATSTNGYALATSGRLTFGQVAGVATITAGTSSVVVTPGVDITAASFVLLTPRADPGVRRLWYTANAATDTITIRTSSTVTTALRVGWLLIG